MPPLDDYWGIHRHSLSPGVGLLFKGICLSQGHPRASAGAPCCWITERTDTRQRSKGRKLAVRGRQAKSGRLRAGRAAGDWLVELKGPVQKAATRVLSLPFSTFLGQARVDLEDTSICMTHLPA